LAAEGFIEQKQREIAEANGLDYDAVKAWRRAQQADPDVIAQIAVARDRTKQMHEDGWRLQLKMAEDGIGCWDRRSRGVWTRLIHSVCRLGDGRVWGHISVSRHDQTMPSWEQLRDAGWAVYPDLTGIEVVAAKAEHFSGAGFAKHEVLHLWYPLTGPPLLPDFTAGFGTL